MAVISILATLTLITDDGKSLPGGVITLQSRIFKPNEKHAQARLGFGHYAKLTIDGKTYQCTDNWLPINGSGQSNGIHPPSGKAEIHEVGADSKAAWTPTEPGDPAHAGKPDVTVTNAEAEQAGVVIKRGKK